MPGCGQTLSEQLEIPEETAMGLVTMGGTDLVALTGFEASDIAESMGIPAEEAAQPWTRPGTLSPNNR